MFEGNKISSNMRKLLSIVFIFFFGLVSGQQLMTPEFLWKLGRINEFDVSPDGKTVIYVVKRYDLAANKGKGFLYSIPVAGGEPKLLADDSWNVNSVRFEKMGSGITFLSAKSGEMQLWRMNRDGSNPMQVTIVPGGISGYLYSPDEKKLVFAADLKTGKTVKDIYPDLPMATGRVADGLLYRHWDSWEDEYSSHLFWVQLTEDAMGKIKSGQDILQNEPYDAPTQPFGGMEEVSWSPDGKYIAYTSKKLKGTPEATSTNTDIFLYELSTGKTLNLSYGMNGYDKNPQFSPDGSRLAWLSMKTPGYESDKNRIIIFDLRKNWYTYSPVKEEDMMKTFGGDLTEHFSYSVENFIWEAPARIYFTATINATQQVFTNDLMSKNSTIVQLTRGDHDITDLKSFTVGKKSMLLVSLMSISSPTELYTVNPQSAVLTQLTHETTQLMSGVKLGKVEKRMIRTTDGKEMLTWVILPPGFDPAKKYPALLYCQGGPQSPVSQFFSYRWNFQLMAANGYIVVAPNRRGLPGFGPEWNDAITGDYGGQCMKDYLSAIDSVAKEPFINKEKLGAVGASFGGFSVYWLAGNHDKRFKCFIAHCGMFNMESWYGSTEEMFFANHDNKGPYWQNPQPANFSASPHLFVRKWDTPILVIHNEKDFRVPVTQGMEAFTAAQMQGIPSRFLCFPDENHWVLKPQNSVLWQREFFRWLDAWLK